MFNKEKIIEKRYYNVLHQKIDFDSERLSEQIVEKIQKTTEKNNLDELLKQIEKLVDEKLSYLKSVTPILFTLFSSIVAFLFVSDTDDRNSLESYMLITAILLILMIVLMISYFGFNFYKATTFKSSRNQSVEFNPVNLKSYCFISDKDFIEKISAFIERALTQKELLSVEFLKQKINSYIARRMCIAVVLAILIFGMGAIALFLLSDVVLH